MPKHIASQKVELYAGLAFFAIGAWLLWCAYEGRGGKSPFLLGIFTPF